MRVRKNPMTRSRRWQPACCRGRWGPSAWTHPGYGVPFGAAVFAGDYIALPAAGLYQPIWEYDAKCLDVRLRACALTGPHQVVDTH